MMRAVRGSCSVWYGLVAVSTPVGSSMTMLAAPSAARISVFSRSRRSMPPWAGSTTLQPSIWWKTG